MGNIDSGDYKEPGALQQPAKTDVNFKNRKPATGKKKAAFRIEGGFYKIG